MVFWFSTLCYFYQVVGCGLLELVFILFFVILLGCWVWALKAFLYKFYLASLFRQEGHDSAISRFLFLFIASRKDCAAKLELDLA